MSGEREGLETQVEQEWARFRGRLADHLAAMSDDEMLLVELESGVDDDELMGAVPYLQFMAWGAGMLRAEAVSNAYLDERFELSPDDEELLVDMGWGTPMYDEDGDAILGETNFVIDAETREADRIAVLAVRTLREVYRCPHPAFLEAAGLEREGPPPVETPIEGPTPLAVFPENEEHLQGLVEATLAEMFEEPLERDEDGDLPITCGRSQTYVRVRGDRPAVEVWADIVIGLTKLDGVAEELDRRNQDDLHRQFFLRDDRIVARAVLPAWPFAPAQLRLIVHLFCDGLDDLAAELVTRFGGRRFLQRQVPPRPGAADPGAREVNLAMVGLLEMLQIGSVPAASVATLFDHDRLAIIRQLVAIRTGVQSCADLDEELVLNHLRRGLRWTVDRGARSERAPGPTQPATAARARGSLRAGHPRQRPVGPGGLVTRLVPESPAFVTASEREVWERLRDHLGPDDVLMAGVRLTNQDKDFEADIVVLMPEAGILVLEVKGGSVWHDEGGWWIKRGDQHQRIHPVDQAREAKYALREYVEHDPRWGGRGHVSWSHGVVTPHAVFGNDFAVPELPRWALHDRSEQDDLAERVRANGWGLAHDHPTPNHDDVELIVEILAGRHHTSYDVNAEAAERASAADRLTQEQAVILQVSRLLHRVEVRGGAGSGKTALALQQAEELTRGRPGERAPQRVALLCYSIGLAEYLKRQVTGWHRKHRPAFVGTFEEFGRQWGAPQGTREDSDFWEDRLPRIMGELAAELPPGKRYDSVIVDEAQDFADAWWRPVLGSLKDEAEGGVYLYSDENQRIFARFGRPPVQLVPLVLDHNLRNTKQIHSAFGPLAPSRMYARGGEGPAVRFVAAEASEALAAADGAVEALLDEGWDPGNVCLLTTGHRHPEQQAQTERHGQVAYWRQFWEGEDVFYGHVLGCKGLERAAVVLCVNEGGERDRARERLYVGMSRATDLLVVAGDPDVIRQVGGDDVARRLAVDDAIG